MRILFGAIVALLLAVPAWAQTIPSYNRIPTCTVAAKASCGAIAGNNSVIRFSDSLLDAMWNGVLGGGTNEVIAYCEGASCWIIGSDAGAANLGAGAVGTGLDITGDITSSPSSSTTNFGENKALNSEFIGLPRISTAVLGAMGNGPILSSIVTPAAATCAPIGGGTESDDAAIFRTGAASYEHLFVAVVGAAEGLDCDVAGAYAVNGTVSYGFWFRSDTTFSAGTLEIALMDGAVEEGQGLIPAYAVADEWIWIEVDVTGDCAATCADIDGVFIQTTVTAPTEMNNAKIYVDSGAFWITGCEETIGADILVDGVLSLVGQPTAAGAEVLLVEWTDYFINYQSGNDAVCTLTDQSANSGVVLYAY